MKAERERRESILRAEGEKKSMVLVAEGHKESAVLNAEGEKEAAILAAEAEKEKKIREAEGQAEAIRSYRRLRQMVSALSRRQGLTMQFSSLRVWKHSRQLPTERPIRLSFLRISRELQAWSNP